MPTNGKEMTATHYEQMFQLSRSPLTRLEVFDHQIRLLTEALRPYGLFYPQDMLPLRDRLDELPNDRFLVVPYQPEQLDFDMLMSKVHIAGRTGTSKIQRRYLEDVMLFPKEPMLLTDVEDGRSRLGVPLQLAYENIRDEERYPYCVWWSIIHAIVFRWVMNHHCISPVGSRHDGYFIEINKRGYTPSLHGLFNPCTPYLGAPSAGGIIPIRR